MVFYCSGVTLEKYSLAAPNGGTGNNRDVALFLHEGPKNLVRSGYVRIFCFGMFWGPGFLYTAFQVFSLRVACLIRQSWLFWAPEPGFCSFSHRTKHRTQSLNRRVTFLDGGPFRPPGLRTAKPVETFCRVDAQVEARSPLWVL